MIAEMVFLEALAGNGYRDPEVRRRLHTEPAGVPTQVTIEVSVGLPSGKRLFVLRAIGLSDLNQMVAPAVWEESVFREFLMELGPIEIRGVG